MSFLNPKLRGICNDGQYHLLGDAAYPIQPCILTPYRKIKGQLTAKKRRFNKIFSATRVLIENAFGLLKQRFRQLQLLEFHKVDTINKFVIACCVLHNLCIFKNDTDPFDDPIPEETNRCAYIPINSSSARNLKKIQGQDKRNQMCNEI